MYEKKFILITLLFYCVHFIFAKNSEGLSQENPPEGSHPRTSESLLNQVNQNLFTELNQIRANSQTQGLVRVQTPNHLRLRRFSNLESRPHPRLRRRLRSHRRHSPQSRIPSEGILPRNLLNEYEQ